MNKINVRWGEILEPQDFIRIDSVVREVVDPIRHLSEEEAIFYLWDYVCRQIKYPDTPPELAYIADRHLLHAFPYAAIPFFGTKYRLVRSSNEWWEYPDEALSWKFADCEGTSIALCALLREYGIGPERVWVVVGELPPGRHAWVEIDGHILETTLSSAPNPSWRAFNGYAPAWRFNDVERIGEIRFVPKGEQRATLNWIGACWQHATK